MIIDDITIRDISLEDLDEQSGFAESLSALSPVNITFDKAKDMYYCREAGGVRTVVAVYDSKIVGTGSIYIEPKFIHGGSFVGHIEDVAIATTFQGGGLGTLIIDKLLEIASNTDCYKVILNCNEKVSTFYIKNGFVPNGTEMRIDLCHSERT